MAVKILKDTDVTYEPASVIDSSGRVFHYENRIFREITDPKAWDLYTKIISSDFGKELFKAGLVETWIPKDIQLQEKKILEHKKIAFVSYHDEWPMTMLWDALKTYIQCSILLAKQGLFLKDGHTKNILFDYSRPVIIDFGSITDIPNLGCFLTELRQYFIIPLWLNKYRSMDIARAYISGTHPENYSWDKPSFIQQLFNKYFKLLPLKNYLLNKKLASKTAHTDIIKELGKLEKYIDHLKPTIKKEYWAPYPNEIPKDNLKPKHVVVMDYLQKLKTDNKTLLDMGANKGMFSFFAESIGYDVVAFDYEEYCVDQIYQTSKERELKILPLYMNFIHPTPESGWGLACKNSFERYRSDITLNLATIHHLCINQHVSFDLFARIIKSYTKKTSIIEFIDRNDIHLKTWNVPEHYQKSNFIKAMADNGFELKNEKPVMETRSVLFFTSKT